MMMLMVVVICRYKERGNIEVQFFNIQARLKIGGRHMYVPPEGKLIRDIESSWMLLEKAEHDRELALREELVRCVTGSQNCCVIFMFIVKMILF